MVRASPPQPPVVRVRETPSSSLQGGAAATEVRYRLDFCTPVSFNCATGLHTMGSSQSKPNNVDECGVLPLSAGLGAAAGATTSAPTGVNNGHWLRTKSFWPGDWCYEGSVCGNGRLRSLDGYNLKYGGLGTCAQAGYTRPTDQATLTDQTGQWFDWHYN